MRNQMAAHVLNTATATEVNTQQRTDNLAVLITEGHAARAQYAVNNGCHIKGKQFSHMKYSSKGSDFLGFYAYFCHVIDDYACFVLQH